MVVVDGRTTIQVKQNIKNMLADMPTDDELELDLIRENIGEVVCVDTIFTKPNGRPRRGFFIDNYLKANFDNYLLPAVELSWDGVILITGIEGCLTGDTLIRINRSELGRKYRLDWLYKQFNHIHAGRGSRQWDLKVPTYIRAFTGKHVRLHKIHNVVYSGKKEVYELTLENGRSIKATANHKFMTEYGWKPLEDLEVGQDCLMCDDVEGKPKNRKRIKLYDIQLPVDYHPYAQGGKQGTNRVEVHRLIYEARINNLEFTEYLDILLNEKEIAKTLKYIDPKKYHIHHKDECHYNNSIENLQLLERGKHFIRHGTYRNFCQGIPSYSKVVSIKHIGVEDTYDIQCEYPHHNFSANDIIVHNSSKSTSTFSFAKYVDPTFPGELIGDGTTHRRCTRIVFTQQQFMEQVDKAQPGQAIVWDEMVLGGLAQDSGSEMQRVLIKKMTTIRKKRLFIFFVIPSIFMLRMYFAIFRTRALIHFYSPDGLQRGYFKFYSYDTKRKLYVRGRKEYNQDCVRADFLGRSINTTGYFFKIEEYEAKKDQAILSITQEKGTGKKEFNAKVQKIKDDRDKLMYVLYGRVKDEYNKQNIKLTQKEFCEILAKRYRLEYSSSMLSPVLKKARSLYGISQSADAELNT